MLVASSSRPRPFGPRWSRMKSSCFDLAGIADGAFSFSELEETIDLTPRENLSNDTAIRSEGGIRAPPVRKGSEAAAHAWWMQDQMIAQRGSQVRVPAFALERRITFVGLGSSTPAPARMSLAERSLIASDVAERLSLLPFMPDPFLPHEKVRCSLDLDLISGKNMQN